jgi:hypothetical protein
MRFREKLFQAAPPERVAAGDLHCLVLRADGTAGRDCKILQAGIFSSAHWRIITLAPGFNPVMLWPAVSSAASAV